MTSRLKAPADRDPIADYAEALGIPKDEALQRVYQQRGVLTDELLDDLLDER